MRIALCILLALLASTWTVGAVVAEEELSYRTFNVSALVNPRIERQGSRLGMLAPQQAEMEAAELPESESFISGESLVDGIRERIDRDSWETYDGAFLEFRGTTLYVRNRADVVKKVGAWLKGLEAQAEGRIGLALTVEESRLGDDAPARRMHSASVETPSGVQSTLKSTRRRQFVVDFDVEIAQGSNIADPVVLFPEEGLIADVRATTLLEGGRVMVEAVIQQGRYGEIRRLTQGVDEECFNKPFRSAEKYRLGTIDLPSFDLTNLHWTAIVDAGGTIEVPVVWNGKKQTFRLRVVPRGETSGGDVLELSHLARPNMPFVVGKGPVEPYYQGRWAPHPIRSSKWAPRALIGAEALLDLTHRLVEPDAWDRLGGLRLIGKTRMIAPAAATPGLREKVKAFLVAREASLLRPLTLDLRTYTVAGKTALGAGASLEGVEDARLLAAGRIPTVSGCMATMQVGNTANFLADYDVEVAQEARMADPVIGQRFHGLVANLVPHVSGSGRTVSVEVEMLLSLRTMDPNPPSLDAQFLGPLDRVEARRSLVSAEFLIPRNGTTVIDLGPDPEDAARRLVVQLGVKVP